jgi:hypothetical protein
VRAPPETGRGFFRLVGEDFGVGRPRMIVEGGVQVGVAEPGPAELVGVVSGGGGAVEFALGAALRAPAAAVGNVAEFLTSTWIRSPGAACS